MRLTALVQSPNHVCCRYRLEAFRPFLEAAGHSLTLRSLPRTPWDWLRLNQELADTDLVILQRKLPNPWQLFLLRRAAQRLCFDFDDAVFARDSYAAKGLNSARRRRRFGALLQAADLVVAGNAFLREQALSHTRGDRVAVIPTCVDPNRYTLAKHQTTGVDAELVWIGSASTLHGLEREPSLLDRLGQRWPGLRLKLICDRSLALQHLRVMPRPWSEATEAEELATSDIGISWVPDDLWSRGKCGLKVLQYMAAGLPVVANPVGVQAAIVQHGETGFLAETPEEWLSALATLLHQPDLRRRMGQAARRRVEMHYSVQVGTQAWLDLLSRLPHQRRQTG
jgi:glycosyltransferase involved in cell wall biosynthesis